MLSIFPLGALFNTAEIETINTVDRTNNAYVNRFVEGASLGMLFINLWCDLVAILKYTLL